MRDLDRERLVPVFEAGSEFEAISVQSFLRGEGIEAGIRDLQIPMMDGIDMVRDPRWGEVVVLESRAETARRLIADYMESLESDPVDDSGTDDDG